MKSVNIQEMVSISKSYLSYPWTWNIRSLYRAGSLVTVSKELSNYKLDLVRVQEVRWKGGGTKLAQTH
jgi:hypothetical protein